MAISMKTPYETAQRVPRKPSFNARQVCRGTRCMIKLCFDTPTSETNRSMMIIKFKHVIHIKMTALTRGITDRKPCQKIQYRQWDIIFYIRCKYLERHRCHDVSGLLASSFCKLAFHCTGQSIVMSQALGIWSLFHKMPWCVIWRHMR